MKLLLADDHGLVREGLKIVLSELEPSFTLVTAVSLPDAIDKAKLHGDLNLALLDLNMPGMAGAASISAFKQLFPNLPTVVLSGSEQLSDVHGTLNHGASGYIPKSEPPAVMLSAIKLVLNGGVYMPHLKGQQELAEKSRNIRFTARQMDVLACLAAGSPNKVIARDLDISEGTVKTHVDAIMNALSARNRTQAVLTAKQLGLIQ